MTKLLYIPDNRFMTFPRRSIDAFTENIEESIYGNWYELEIHLRNEYSINLLNDKEFREINNFPTRWDLYPLSKEEFEFVM